MSEWIDLVNADNIELSDDKKTVLIMFETNEFGNRWIEIPIEFLRDVLQKAEE